MDQPHGTDELKRIYAETPHSLLETLADHTRPAAEAIAERFYATLMADEETRPFLSPDMVQRRLKASLGRWLLSLFEVRSAQEVVEFAHHQVVIGQVHARINIPLSALNKATAVLKEALFEALITHIEARSTLVHALLVSSRLIDQSTAIMNQVYLHDLVDDARYAQALKLEGLGRDMAVQSERLRASLLDWHRRALPVLLTGKPGPEALPTITKTNFGLWVAHKGDLLFPDSAQIDDLKAAISALSTATDTAMAARSGNPDDFRTTMAHIDDLVTRAAAILSDMAEQSLAVESGRDPLTKLFNRRFLRTVLQREARNSMRTGIRFALLLIDIDHFKQVNDTYGHDTGDEVLRAVANILIEAVRAGDFVFRYGGEEFLVVVNQVSPEQAFAIAEKLRRRLETTPITRAPADPLAVTASIGVAVHEGHPDYSRVLGRADRALYLYEAKDRGRNCVVTSD